MQILLNSIFNLFLSYLTLSHCIISYIFFFQVKHVQYVTKLKDTLKI